MTTVTSNKNETLLRTGYEAFATGNLAAFNTLFTPEITWHVPGRNPLSGDKLGLQSTLEYFGELGARTNGTFRLELQDVYAHEDSDIAVGRHHETAARAGRAFDHECVIVFRLEGERVAEAWLHYFDQTVVDAFFA